MRYLTLAVALAVLPGAAMAAPQKMDAACFYESGQNGSQTISDFTILNNASAPIPKGTVISYVSSGAPGKTFTVKAPKDIAPQDSFSSGGTEPMGSCKAWWMK